MARFYKHLGRLVLALAAMATLLAACGGEAAPGRHRDEGFQLLELVHAAAIMRAQVSNRALGRRDCLASPSVWCTWAVSANDPINNFIEEPKCFLNGVSWASVGHR